MPYTTPPTFVDTNILSAADLNILSDNQEWFAGIAGGPNPGIVSQSSEDETYFYMVFRKRQRYLNFSYTWSGGGDGTRFTMAIYDDLGDYENIYDDPNPGGNTTETIYVDLDESAVKLRGDGAGAHSGDPWGLTLTAGNWYTIRVYVRVSPADTVIWNYCFNTDGTSL